MLFYIIKIIIIFAKIFNFTFENKAIITKTAAKLLINFGLCKKCIENCVFVFRI